jgi:hypothetical protein
LKGIKGDHCLLKVLAVKKASRKSLIDDKEEDQKRNYTKKAMESVEIESKNLR